MKILLSVTLASVAGVAAVNHMGGDCCLMRALKSNFCHEAAPCVDEPAPIDCPLCAGDAALHKRIVNTLAVQQVSASYTILDGGWF